LCLCVQAFKKIFSIAENIAVFGIWQKVADVALLQEFSDGLNFVWFNRLLIWSNREEYEPRG